MQDAQQQQQQQQQQQLVLARPLPGANDDERDATAVILIHSGGGGAFSWRHVMAQLAEHCGVRVVAFDRPGFGLTSRPPPPPAGSGRPDPYAPAAQALLVLQLCGALGVRRAVLVAHGDGCLIAVMAAALANRQVTSKGLVLVLVRPECQRLKANAVNACLIAIAHSCPNHLPEPKP
jgi:pimeloyl-ACP methyl ester carboxylesterase